MLYALIPAAGMGACAAPYTKDIPKSMLNIDGVPNLQRFVEIMRDQLDIEDIYIVVGYLKDIIQDHFRDASKYRVNITYIQNNDLDKGLTWSIFQAQEYISGFFYTMLSDECYVSSNHHDQKTFPYQDSLATCALMKVDDQELIKQN